MICTRKGICQLNSHSEALISHAGLEAWVKGVICNTGGVQTWHYIVFGDTGLQPDSSRVGLGAFMITQTSMWPQFHCTPHSKCVLGHNEWPPTHVCNISGGKSSLVHGWCSKIKWIKHSGHSMLCTDNIICISQFILLILWQNQSMWANHTVTYLKPFYFSFCNAAVCPKLHFL